MTDIGSKTSSKVKALGIYQIIGGAIGIILILWGFVNTQQLSGLVALIYLFMLLLFAFSIYCGILCLKKSAAALKFSLINQILQIIGFAMFGFAFQYAAGVYLTVGLDLTESFNFTFGAGLSKFDLTINNGSQRAEVTFNFIALILIVFIERTKKQTREEHDKSQVESIAQ